MKPCCFTIAVPLLIANFFAFAAAAAETRPLVAVYLQFDRPPSAFLLDQMKRETSAIMDPAGFDLIWREDAESAESFSKLVVVHFHGSCGMYPVLFGVYSPEAQAAALASTAIADGHVLPFSTVECDEVRRYIAHASQRDDAPELTLGRALGRVMAHEMYHMLLKDTSHSSGGIARAYQRRTELTARIFRFQPSEIEKLRASLK